ncbi:MAG: extracellular solute-binding protein [Clostridiaceae bacterium]|nr:extracellular solute-binding protein [Clostridiaceae bacterium]
MKKRKIRPFIFLIYIVLILFVILGPFYLFRFHPRDAEHDKMENRSQWTGVITFWDFPRLDSKSGTSFGWIYEKIQAFEKANPGVYIDFKPLDWERGPIKLDTAIKMGHTPDIAAIGSDYSIIGKGILEPLNQYVTTEEIEAFREEAIRAVTYDNNIWAMPWMMTTYTMVLNLDLFNERNVEPPVDGNWTYEEFIEKMEELTYDSKENGKIDYFGFHSFIQPGYYNTWGILLSDGGEILNETFQYSFNDKRAVDGLEKLINLKQKYSVTPEDFGENTASTAWTSFYKDQNVAVHPVGTWALNVLENLKNEGVGFDYTIANYPTGKLEYPVTMSSSIGAYGIFKQEDEEKLKVAAEFLKFLTKDEYQQDLGRLGVFPVKKSVGNIYEGNIFMTSIFNNMESVNTIPLHPQWNEIDKILQNEIRMGVLGKKSPEEVLRDAETKIQIFMQSVEE